MSENESMIKARGMTSSEIVIDFYECYPWIYGVTSECRKYGYYGVKLHYKVRTLCH